MTTGVQSAAVNVICELARRNPKNYLSLAPLFFKLMTSSTNNWVLIKIIKLASARTRGPVGAAPPRGPAHRGSSLLAVRRSDPAGAEAGQEADRAPHQPHPQVSARAGCRTGQVSEGPFVSSEKPQTPGGAEGGGRDHPRGGHAFSSRPGL